MYLPSWAVAALAVFRAANLPDYQSSSELPGYSQAVESHKFNIITEKDLEPFAYLSVSKAEEGGVVKLFEIYDDAKDPKDITLWEFKRTQGGWTIKLPDHDLCVTAKTKKVKGKDEEWYEGEAGEITLLKCPEDEPDEDRTIIGGYWSIDGIGAFQKVILRLAFSYELAIAHDNEKMTVTGVLDEEHSDDKLFRLIPILQK